MNQRSNPFSFLLRFTFHAGLAFTRNNLKLYQTITVILLVGSEITLSTWIVAIVSRRGNCWQGRATWMLNDGYSFYFFEPYTCSAWTILVCWPPIELEPYNEPLHRETARCDVVQFVSETTIRTFASTGPKDSLINVLNLRPSLSIWEDFWYLILAAHSIRRLIMS
ncbi:hypothetical protein BDV41DRAFT_520028 [Aspergillus transmontanensis]|uniref:Uncharacterized protein n=1 Tax=Aspergillus transmontanensis TaxID=1034304 RepID=A0A5N6WF81_9EURO|nr:hypothetical protein BDV41DRAFT_520028 [Aspergillus transmontanensis]